MTEPSHDNETVPETVDSFVPTELRERNVPVVRQLIIALGILAVVFGSTYTGTLATLMRLQKPSTDVVRIEATIAETAQSEHVPSHAFDDISLSAKAAFVWDVETQRVLFNKNADERLPLASITKLMTALVAHELLDEAAEIGISVDAIRESGDSGFSDGETFSVRNLTNLTLVTSSNDGAHALSAAAGATLTETTDSNGVFIQAMNVKAEEIGLSNTEFYNVTGLDISKTKAGAYGSARDMALLLEYILTRYPDLVALTTTELTTVDNTSGEYHIVKNTNNTVDEIQGLIASKTGYTELAGGNLIIAFDAGLNHPIVVVVLGSTQEDRFADARLLADRARLYVSDTQ